MKDDSFFKDSFFLSQVEYSLPPASQTGKQFIRTSLEGGWGKDEGALKSSNNEANIIVLFVSWQYADGSEMAIVRDERGMAERNFLRLLAPQTRTIIINELLGKVYE